MYPRLHQYVPTTSLQDHKGHVLYPLLSLLYPLLSLNLPSLAHYFHENELKEILYGLIVVGRELSKPTTFNLEATNSLL